ncbi:hypothetical protein CyaNS01_00165 [Cyanobium sp. NS01]|nr:hypothetical protein CyaNS01_00165 [Cyanobium sp. NS01]
MSALLVPGIYASPSPQGSALPGKKCNSFTKKDTVKTS